VIGEHKHCADVFKACSDKMCCEDVYVVCREFSAVEVDAYNRLNSIEPVIVPDKVIFAKFSLF